MRPRAGSPQAIRMRAPCAPARQRWPRPRAVASKPQGVLAPGQVPQSKEGRLPETSYNKERSARSKPRQTSASAREAATGAAHLPVVMSARRGAWQAGVSSQRRGEASLDVDGPALRPQLTKPAGSVRGRAGPPANGFDSTHACEGAGEPGGWVGSVGWVGVCARARAPAQAHFMSLSSVYVYALLDQR